MSKFKHILAALSIVGILAAPSLASADVNNFTITNFTAGETLSRADPQGELRVVEHINVDFTDNNHGILRAIPASYKNHSLQMQVNSIKSDSGAPTQYTTYGSNGNTVLKIGDPNNTVTGSQEYTIDYTLRNVISFYKDHDELYWDVNGNQWQQPFDHVEVTLNLPNGLQQSRAPLCYTGSFGGASQNCAITDTGNIIHVQTSAPLQPYQTLTYVAGFQNGYFHPAKWYETLGEHTKQLMEFFVPFLILGGGSFLYWLNRGRDPKGTGIIVPQYDPPDGLKPMAVGTIADFKLDNQDLTATIIDLAIRGYIKIIETKKDQILRKDKLTYSLQLVNPDFSALDPNEQLLIGSLFTDRTVGATVDISVLKNTLYKTAKTLSTNVENDLTAQGYFRGNPTKAGGTIGILLAIAFFIVIFAGTELGIWAILGCVVGGIIAFICLKAAAARTVKGVAANEHIQGLKLYLNVAEKDRLEKLQAPNAEYAANAAEPVKTVDLFEKLLPYAMVLGVEKQWAKQFENLYTSPPNWYSGNWGTFNAIYLASALSDGIGSAVNTAFSAPSSSNSSGFSGGFSGGGGGGGGGGGW